MVFFMISYCNRFCLFRLDYSKKPIRFDFVFSSPCFRDIDFYIKRFSSEDLVNNEHFVVFERKNKSWYQRCMYFLNPLTFERVFYPTDYKGIIDDTYFNNSKYDFDGLKFNLQEQYDFAVKVGNKYHVQS